MNREIKFRIGYTAQNDSKTMHYSDDKLLIGMNGEIYENYGVDWKKPMWEVPFDTAALPILMQYTECRDKNGKEIYEGDIVIYKFPNGSVMKGGVSFIAGMFVLDFPDQTDSGPIGFLQALDMEVIGNVFENPDLLK